MTGITIIIKLFLITYTAYGFSKIKFKGRDAIFLVLLAAMMIPADIMILPRYMIFKNLKLLNTMWAIIIPSCVERILRIPVASGIYKYSGINQ